MITIIDKRPTVKRGLRIFLQMVIYFSRMTLMIGNRTKCEIRSRA